MMKTILRATLLLASAFLATSLSAEEQTWPALPNLHVLSPTLITSGQPKADDFAALKAAGVTTIINLRPESEHADFNEAQLVQQLGLRYIHIPVAGAGDISAENAARLDAELKKLSGKTLVHCASSNRVGALFALAAAARGDTPEQAISAGRSAGMKSLERVVREKLAAPCPAAATSC